MLGVSTWKDRSALARAAGSEYLNAEFGWKPFISDIRKFSNAVRHADAVLAQYERDAGKQVRRSYHFPEQRIYDRSIVATSVGSIWGPLNSNLLDGSSYGTVERVRETTRRQWFSGAFTYHLPTGYDSRSKMARYALESKKLFGLSLTPETLWNLAPWSWAVDWFSNTGDVVSNLTDWATDGLVMRYGYLMEHSIVRDTYTHTGSGLIGLKNRVSPLTFVIETKIRKRANPFGFGVSWNGLSPFQLSIAAALGLSRSS
jgi:hypothetical protein